MPGEMTFKTTPRAHQLRCWEVSRDREYFALLLDMGTGKTKIVLDTVAWLFWRGRVDSLLVVAPNGVHANWVDQEIPKHLPDEIARVVATYDADGGVASRRRLAEVLEPAAGRLRILAVNVEAVATSRAFDACRALLTSGRALMCVDESIVIKNAKAARTKAVRALQVLAPFRRIACGNPFANSPLDVYEQCEFLQPGCLGHSSVFAFRNRFAVVENLRVSGGPRPITVKKVVGFKDLDELKRRLSRFAFIVKKEECLDLPPKIYLPPRVFEMTPKQRRAYEEMRQFSVAEIGRQMELFTPPAAAPPTCASLDDLRASSVAAPESPEPEPQAVQVASARIVLTQILRLQQIACGFVVTEDGSEIDLCDGDNPRISELLAILDEEQGKVIIWAPFRRSLDEIQAALTKKYGPESTARYEGSADDLMAAVARFQDPASGCRFFLSNQHKGGRGLTLVAASLVVYFANTYDNETREQSEDRPHRDGLTHPVAYVDLHARGAGVETQVRDALRRKKTVGDLMREGSWRELFR